MEKHNSDSEDSYDTSKLEPEKKKAYRPMPKKSKYRMRAHINPLGDVPFPYPQSPDYVDWSIHYPAFFKSQCPADYSEKIVTNTFKYPLEYKNIQSDLINGKEGPKVEIVDIGCGYGGLLFELSPIFPETLILGMEIRDKVANFVAEKIHSKRVNSNDKECSNIAVFRTNTMKTLLNYFRKDQLSKMFFCYADPHFKKANYRRRIISSSLLTEYAFVLKDGGKIYVVSDVKDLYDWEVAHLSSHPLFERVGDKEVEEDPCVDKMVNGTDEAKKVAKKGGAKYYAVFRKRLTKLDVNYLL